MTKTFTENDLVRLIYNEVSTEEQIEIQQSLVNNPELQLRYEEMRETTELLEGFTIKAPNDVVDRILYAERHIPSA